MPASAAVAAGPGGMPTRPYSMRILGGSWPSTSPEPWSDTANALSKKSADLSMSAAAIRRAADDLGGSNSGGQMIDAMCERSYRTAQTVINHSDLYGDMAKAVKETAELIWHARGQLEEIDRKAHEEIERLKQQLQAAALSPLGAGAAMAAIYAAIEAVITAAQGEALTVGIDTAAAIAEQAANIGGNPPQVKCLRAGRSPPRPTTPPKPAATETTSRPSTTQRDRAQRHSHQVVAEVSGVRLLPRRAMVLRTWVPNL